MGAIGTPLGGMAITKADIEAFVNASMEESISSANLAEIIKLCMRDLSNFNFLQGEDTTQTLSSGDAFLTCPDYYKDIEEIQLTDSSGDKLEPLDPFSGGYKEYLRCMGESQSNGEPQYYCERNGKFFIYPPADGDYDVTITYYRYDSQDEDNIEFNANFFNALKFGCCYFYALMKARTRYIDIWESRYREEKEMCRLNMKQQPKITE